MLFDLLASKGETDLMIRILTNDKYPSFKYMLNGETTLVENHAKYWVNSDGSFSNEDVSHNHPIWGSIIKNLFKDIAGLNLSKLYSKKVIFAPSALKEVRFAKASKITPYGMVNVEYNYDFSFKMKILIPSNLSGKICLPSYIADKLIVTNMETKETKIFKKPLSFTLPHGNYLITTL